MRSLAAAGSSALFLAVLWACSSGSDATSSGGSSSGSTVDGGSSGTDGEVPNPTAGCGTAVTKTGFLGSQSIDVGGTTRTYALTLPKGYDGKKAYPVVLVFHGDGGDGEGLRSYFDIEQASGDGAIFAYPDGFNASWNTDDAAALKDDIAFVEAIVTKLQGTYCADQKKVFLTGFSKGAYFVNQVACRTKLALKGIVTHSGGGPYGLDEAEFDANGDLVCPAQANGGVAALQVQGESDGVVDPSEGVKAREYWRSANGCGTSTSPTSPSPCVSYDGCTRPEIWCLVPDMGHSLWPGNAGQVTWDFFVAQ